MGYWKNLFIEIAEENGCSFDEAVEMFEEEMEKRREQIREDEVLGEEDHARLLSDSRLRI